MKTEKLLLCEILIKSNRIVKEQIEEWIKKTKSTKRTFFRYKKILLNIKPELAEFVPFRTFIYGGAINALCYFCRGKALLIHHINENRKDNKKDNLLPLCSSCHNKIHRIYNKWEEVSNNDILTK